MSVESVLDFMIPVSVSDQFLAQISQNAFCAIFRADCHNIRRPHSHLGAYFARVKHRNVKLRIFDL